jgi:lysophospholipase L1-like esterase
VNRTVGLLLLAAGIAAGVGTYFIVTAPAGVPVAASARAAATVGAAPPSWVTVQAGASAPASASASASASAAPLGVPAVAGAATATRTTATAKPPAAPSASAAAPLPVMALGDSITYGIGSATSSSYRVGLRRKLVNAGLAVDFVGSQRSGSGTDRENEGHPGWTIAQLSDNVTGWLAAYRPDVVLVHAGTNDLKQNAAVVGAPGRLAALIDRIHAARPSAQVFVQQLVSSSDATVQVRIDAFNAALPAAVAGKGSWLHLVDQSGVEGTMLRDDLHPNDAGYAQMADNLYASLAATYGLSGS